MYFFVINTKSAEVFHVLAVPQVVSKVQMVILGNSARHLRRSRVLVFIVFKLFQILLVLHVQRGPATFIRHRLRLRFALLRVYVALPRSLFDKDVSIAATVFLQLLDRAIRSR